MRTKKYWRRMRYLEDEEILEEEEILEGEEMLEENEILEEEEVLEEEEMFEVEERREEVVEGDDGKMGAAEFERGEKVGGGEAGEMVREASEAGGEGGGQGGHRVRELPKKKCSFNLDFVQNRSDPGNFLLVAPLRDAFIKKVHLSYGLLPKQVRPPPLNFGTFGALFRKSEILELLGH